MNKENDLFLNMLYNPDLSLQDLHDDGLTLDNTGMQDMDSYRNNEKARRFFTTDDGKFDEKKFQTAYQNALASYNMLAQMDTDQAIINRGTYSRTNIFAPIDRVRKGPDIGAPVKIANPLRQQGSITTLGRMEDPKFSISEIAQTQQVYDPETGKWSDAPNDTFAGLPYFFDTLVLAQWDEDGTHVDPVSGEEVKHTKGELKLNDDGTYYYEKLAGRLVYDKQVLNKMNILTTDGSWINKYDFFDSDDINEKSAFGTILKNAVLVGTMFIPTVGPWIAAASIASQSVGFLGTLGKMLTSSDNELFSNMEGWSKSVNRQTAKTDYAQQNFMCWENMIDLIGDVVGQLNEQRVLFKKLPAIFKGKAGMTNEGIKEYEAAKTAEFYTAEEKKLAEALATKNQQLLNKGSEIILDPQSISQQVMFNASTLAKAATDAYVKSYNKIGSVISKAYMTAITTQDMYGEAKNAGASDIEATLLTLGYSAAEAWLLNTGVGEHILPELRAEHIGTNKIVKALADIKWNKEMDKVSYAKALFRKGKDLFNEGLEGGSMAKAMFAHGLGEGIEEVSEELLADFSRGCFNLSQWLQNDDTRMNFDNWQERYIMSFVGGVVGGAINAPFTTHEQIKGYKNINSKQAFQEAMYMMRNGRKKELYKAIDDNQFANKHLSSRVAYDINGKPIYETANSYEDSQDFEVKQILKEQLDNLSRIMKTEGGDLSDDTFLSIQTKDDIRFKMLQESAMASKFLQNYQNNFNQIYDLVTQLNPDASLTDRQRLKKQKEQQEDSAQEETEETKTLKEKLDNLRTEQKKLLSGEYTSDFIGAALFEMSPALNSRFIQTNFIQWAEKKSGKDFDNIPEDQKTELAKQFKEYMDTDGKDDIWNTYQRFKAALQDTSDILSKYSGFTEDNTTQLLSDTYDKAIAELYQNDDATKSQQTLSSAQLLVDMLQTNQLQLDPEIDEDKAISTYQKVANLSQQIVDEGQEKGYINNVAKNRLIDLLNNVAAFGGKYEEDYDEITYSLDQIFNNINIIESIDESPIDKILNEISGKILGKELNYKETFSALQSLIESKKSNLDELILGNLEEDITDISTVLDLTESLLNATKTDNIDFGRKLNARSGKQTEDLTNLWGYTRTLNELNQDKEGYKKLVELDSNTANVLLQDVQLIRNQLNFLQHLSAINNAQKLNAQTKIDLIQSNLHFKRFKNFIVSIPDSWTGKNELIAKINSFDKLSDIENNLDIDDETKVEVKKQYLQFQDAIYDFFQQNSNKDFSEILNKDSLDFITQENLLLNEESDHLSDHDFIWWLASRAAVKASDFYSLYKKCLIPGIAPIPGQELAIYNCFASVINKNIYLKFNQAIKDNIVNYLSGLSIEERKKYLYTKFHSPKEDQEIWSKDENIKYLPSFTGMFPIFDSINLIDGIAGSGKTKAVLVQLLNLVKNSNAKDVLKKVWVMHGASIDSAKELVQSIEIGTAYSREEAMIKLVSDWTNNTQGDGTIQYSNDQFYYSDDNIQKTKSTFNELGIDSPSIIIIDEVSKFTCADLDQINQYAKAHGIPVIVCGDMDQTQIAGSWTDTRGLELPSKDFDKTVELVIGRENFITTPKLGTSNRTANSQKNVNQKTMIAAIHENKPNVTFHYYESDTELNGEKTISVNNSGKILEPDTVKNDIEIMINNLQDGEKIGYMYYDTETPLYKLLSENYKDKIDFFKDTTAQGKEASYYIVEINPNSNQFARDLYTGITRSIKASLIVQNSNYINKSIKDEITQQDNLSEKSIERYTEKYLNILDQLDLKGEEIKYEPPTVIPVTISAPTKSGGLSSGTPTIKTPHKPKPTSTNPTTAEGNNTPTSKTSHEPTNISQIVVTENGRDQIYKLVSFPIEGGKTDSVFDVGGCIFTVIKQSDDVFIPVMYNGQSWHYVKTFDEDNIEFDSNPIDSNIIEGLNKAIDVNNIKAPSWINSSNSFLYDAIPELKPFYDFDSLPIIEESIIPENEYKKRINTENEEKEAEEPPTDFSSIPVRFYTFNTFYTGTKVDENGKFTVDPARIDSINGLNNIERLQGKSGLDSYANYVFKLAYLRDILLNTASKEDMCNYIADILNLKGVQIQFAYKKVNDEKAIDANKNDFAIYNREKKAELSYIYSDDIKSKNVPRGLGIAKIYTNDFTSDGQLVLEIPLFAFTNPISLIKMKRKNGDYAYPELAKVFDETQGPDYEKLKAVQTILPKEAQILNDLIELYKFPTTGVFNFDQFSIGKDWNEWTPAKNLHSSGPQIIKSAGVVQQSSGYDYTAKWISLKEFSQNPNVQMSKILSSRTGEYNGIKFAHAGHPFVLVSYNRNINNLFDYYMRQLSDPNLRKEVKLVYVLPPKSDLREYIDNLYNRINKRPSMPIGQINTSFKILEQIINDKEFADSEFVKWYPTRYKYIKDVINDLSKLDEQERNDQLTANTDWNNISLQMGRNIKLYQQLDRYLMSLVYKEVITSGTGFSTFSDEGHQNHFNKLYNILHKHGAIDIWFRTMKPNENDTVYLNNSTTFEVVQDDDYTYMGRDYNILGKVDSPIFTMDNIGYLLRNFVQHKINPPKNPNDVNTMWSSDSTDYFQKVGLNNKTKKANPKVTAIDEQLKLAGLSQYSYSTTNVSEYANDIAKKINAGSHSVVAFVKNNQLVISQKMDIFNNKTISILDDKGSNTQYYSKAAQLIVTDKTTNEQTIYNVVREKEEKKEIIKIQEQIQNTVSEPIIPVSETKLNLSDDQIQTLQNALSDTAVTYDFDNLKELQEQIDDDIDSNLGTMVIEDLTDIKNNNSNPDTQQLLQTLIDYINTKMNDSQEKQEEREVCSNYITLIF